MAESPDFSLSCPIPISDYPHVLLAHGGGGRLMHQLIDRIFRGAFAGLSLQSDHDAAVFDLPANRIAFTTDSFVVDPYRFPGGDIGMLAVNGTVNDLAMSGAQPSYLSVGFIIEEGLPMEELWRIAQSMAEAARKAGVRIATGDTKVVDRGKGDGIYINTSGVGVLEHNLAIAPASVRHGDAVIVSGDLGRHGIAIMAVREGLAFESEIESDAAPLNHAVAALLEAGIDVRCLRDLTRGGLTSALNEIASAGNVGIDVSERDIPVRMDVRGACEMLGLDPLYVANEGRFAAVVGEADADRACDVLHAFEVSEGACRIGTVTPKHKGLVYLKSAIGVPRILDVLSGEQLPRIC